MDLTAPISTIMSTELITVKPKDKLTVVKEILDNKRIHHVPVVDKEILVGLISKSDLKHFYRGKQQSEYDELLERTRLKNYCAEDIMTNGLSTLTADDSISSALELFKTNLFHSIPIVNKDELVGIITCFDIINALSKSA